MAIVFPLTEPRCCWEPTRKAVALREVASSLSVCPKNTLQLLTTLNEALAGRLRALLLCDLLSSIKARLDGVDDVVNGLLLGFAPWLPAGRVRQRTE